MVAEEKGLEGVVPLAEALLVGDVATLPPKNASSMSSPRSLHSTSTEGVFVPPVDPPPMFPATTTAPTPIDINLSPSVVEAMALDAPLPPPPAAEDEVAAMGKATSPAVSKLRRSSRNAGKADEHTLHKVERMALKKNLESSGTSFSNFPDSVIVSNLGRIGINLASSDVVVIKNLEVDRLVLSANLKKPKSVGNNFASDDEREERPEAVLDHVCGNLNVEI